MLQCTEIRPFTLQKMKKTLTESTPGDNRMKDYLQKIATGPKMSKNLTEIEAEDALTLILGEKVSAVRSAVFLIAARMKLETLEENIGYWRAMDKTTIRHPIQQDRLLQIADPFDGFNRVPYFGFYTIPVLAAIGLPTYGHSAPSLPPSSESPSKIFSASIMEFLHRETTHGE